MDKLHIAIAENLKKLRKDRKLSLDKISTLTGVSKSMLSQIERGESSPTVATLWKIATGLHISFTTFMESFDAGTVQINNNDLNPLKSDHGHFRIYPIFPFDKNMGFEILSIEIDGGSHSSSTPHEDGTEEFVTVYEGVLTLNVGSEEYNLHAGSSLRFHGNQKHCYSNPEKGIARFYNVIYYNNHSVIK